MEPRPKLHPKRKRELAEVGIGPQGEPQFSPRPRDKSPEKTVRSTNNHQPKKDIIMETATQRHVHEAPPAAEEPSPIRIGQLADKAAGQVDQLHQAMLETRRPANIATDKLINFGLTALAVLGAMAFYNWAFKPKAIEVLAPAPGVRK